LDKIQAIEDSLKIVGYWGSLLQTVAGDNSHAEREKTFWQKAGDMRMQLRNGTSVYLNISGDGDLEALGAEMQEKGCNCSIAETKEDADYSVAIKTKLGSCIESGNGLVFCYANAIVVVSSPKYGKPANVKIPEAKGGSPNNNKDKATAEAFKKLTSSLAEKLNQTITGYNLQMTIAKTSDKMTIASYSGTFSYWDLDNRTGIRKASLELLKKMGVSLTAKAQGELAGAATASYASGQTAFAKGIAVQRQGNEVAALSYYFQASAFDPSMREAASRSSTLNANISGGGMGDNVRNDIQWRKQWVDRLRETEQFFDNFNKMESMPYTLFYSKEISQGKINYQNETVALSIETYLYGSDIWTVSIERALQAVYDGLNATKRKEDWGLDRWPQRGVTELNAFERRSKNFSVVLELVNNQNKVIGRQTLQAGGSWGLNWRGRPSVEMSSAGRKTLNFQNVNANDISFRVSWRYYNNCSGCSGRLSEGAENSFQDFYNKNGKKAGIYIGKDAGFIDRMKDIATIWNYLWENQEEKNKAEAETMRRNKEEIEREATQTDWHSSPSVGIGIPFMLNVIDSLYSSSGFQFFANIESFNPNLSFFCFGFNLEAGFLGAGRMTTELKKQHPDLDNDSTGTITGFVKGGAFARLYPVSFIYLSGGANYGYYAGMEGKTSDGKKIENAKIQGTSMVIFPVGAGLVLGFLEPDKGLVLDAQYNIAMLKNGFGKYWSFNIGAKFGRNR
jgi:hypothetical protein